MSPASMANEQIEQGALLAINHSGGKDSQAMMIHLLEAYPVEPKVVVHASLGRFEWPGALELAQAQADSAGIPFIVAKAGKSFSEMVIRRHARRPDVPSWPSSATRQCTSDLKRGPCERELRRYMKSHGFSRVINCMGFRAEESSARARRSEFRRIDRNCTRERDWFEYLPIFNYAEADVFQRIQSDGQSAHPAYAGGNRRLSCMFCIMGCPGDIQHAARKNPALYRELVELETATGYTMHQSGRSLPDLVGEELCS